MTQNSANLAALIGSRICHDLISPIGAIDNGLELLGLTGSAPGPELNLIADSVGNANARIRFFRIAYGAAGDQALGRAEVVSVLDDMSRGGRLALSWAPADPQPRAAVRLAFLAIQCCETAMPYGGSVAVTQENGAWSVTGRADKLNVDDGLWGALSAPQSYTGITPAQVQFALLPVVAADLGRSLRVESGAQAVSIRF